MALTVSTHLAIPSLIGRGLTEDAARTALGRAKLLRVYNAQVGSSKIVPIEYSHGKFTIGVPR